MTKNEQEIFLLENYTEIECTAVAFCRNGVEGARIVKIYVANEICKNGYEQKWIEELKSHHWGLYSSNYENHAFVEIAGTNVDMGTYDFITAVRWSKKCKDFGIVNIYLSAILVRPFTKDQREKYSTIRNKFWEHRQFHIYDNRSER